MIQSKRNRDTIINAVYEPCTDSDLNKPIMERHLPRLYTKYQTVPKNYHFDGWGTGIGVI